MQATGRTQCLGRLRLQLRPEEVTKTAQHLQSPASLTAGVPGISESEFFIHFLFRNIKAKTLNHANIFHVKLTTGCPYFLTET